MLKNILLRLTLMVLAAVFIITGIVSALFPAPSLNSSTLNR